MKGDCGTAEDAVVISGIAGRFPKANNVLELKKNFYEKVDCTTTDHGRWNVDHPEVPMKFGAIEGAEQFDRVYFAVHDKLCKKMEAASRLLLEHSVEAVIDAGINPNNLKGTNVAVFVNTNVTETLSLFSNIQADGFEIVGSAKTMISNRISFSMGLTGTSVHIDVGSAGGIATLEKAFHALKNDECEGVIIAGGILLLQPEISLQFKQQGFLSNEGKSRSFDDNAKGHFRSDGVAAMYLQKAKNAKRIYMEVVGARATHTDCIQFNSFLFPKLESQVKLMKEVLDECGLSPDDITYLEASGYAIKDIDADELEAIDRVYGKRKEPIYVSSVISNIGNAIPVNSYNAIIKAILGMEDKKILPNLNYEKPNSKAPGLISGRIRIPTEVTPVKGQYVAINTTSESGAFGIAILKSPDIEKTTNNDSKDGLPRLVVVSGRTEEAIDAILTYLETNPVDVEFCQMLNDLFEIGVDKHMQKGYTVLPASGVLHKKLQIRGSNAFTGVKRQVWWVFSGMGSQWSGMGADLLKIPVFNDAIRKCDKALKPLGYDIYKIITDKDPKMFDNIIHSFVGIAAIQIGLVDVLRYVGLEPDFIIGHSVGELGCAYADGCVTAEQMIMAALSRGLASKEVDLIPGSMAAVGLGYDDVKPLCPPDIDVACHNGPDSTTISGPAESMKKFVASLTANGIFAREVASSGIAYHSRYIAPAGSKLLERLQKVIPNPNPRSPKWVSTSVPKAEWNSLKARLCSAEYHTNNLLSPVLFDETARQIPNGSICIEIAPHGLLQAILKKSLHSSCTNIPLTKRGHYDNSALVLAALGNMYTLDLNPKISNLYPKIKYPVGTGTPSISPFIKWDHTNKAYIEYYQLDKAHQGEKTIEIDLNKVDDDYLKANTINGQIVTPLISCLNKAWDAFKNWQTPDTKDSDAEEILNVVFDDIKVYKPLLNIPDDNIIRVLIAVLKGTGRIEIIDEKSREVIASAAIKSTTAPSQERFDIEKSKYQREEKYDIGQEDFYTEMEMRGLNYSKVFKNVLRTTYDGSNGIVRWDNNWVTFIDSVLQLYAFGNDTRQALVPVSIRKIVIDFDKQENIVNNLNEVNVIIDKSLNYISAGGLEIQGLQFARLPKQHEQSYMSNDVLAVVPNIDVLSTPLPIILRLVLQIIIENNFSEKLQRIELVGDKDSQNMKVLQKALLDVPEINLFKQDISTLESATYGNILTVINGSPGEHNIEQISYRLKEGKFLLMTWTNAKQDSYLKSVGELGLKPVFLRKTESGIVVLLRKIRSSRKIHRINITECNKKSAEMICKSVNNLPDNERIAVLVQSNQNINSAISEIVHQIELTGSNLSKVRIFLLHGVKAVEDPFSDEFYKSQLELDLLINILTPRKVWATLRRTTVILNEKMCQTWAANQTTCNKPLSINWTEGRPLDSIGNLVQVEYSAINPQDLLIADGTFYIEGLEKSRIEQIGVGLEYSGIDQKLSRVMGITCGNSLANFANVDPTWMWAIPKTWSFEDAATVPLSYVMAYWALIVKAEAEAKERVLVTNIFDGISLATINLALHKKCDVFVAYETESEKEMISLAFPKIPSNRLFKLTNNSFRDEILLQTKGEGVNVVIANQCEIKQLEVFFTAVKQNARAVIISDLNDSEIHGKVGMNIFLKELSFYSVVPKKVLLSDLKTKKMLANMVQDGINNGSVKPLPRGVYQRESLAKALNTCLAKENLGKIVIKVAPKDAKINKALAIPRLHCSDQKSYLVIEGLTTFGLELIDWLITRGARQIVVASSMNVENGFQNSRIRIWQGYGVKINLHTETDLAEQKTIKALFKQALSLGPIDAIFDLRRTNCNKRRFSSDTLDSTTKILDQESRNVCSELRLFVVCSAVTNAGALANTQKTERYTITSSEQKLVDEIVEKRKRDGLPGLIIRLGLVNAIHINTNKLPENVVLPAVSKYILKFDEVLGTDENVVEVSFYKSLADEVEEYVDASKEKLNAEDTLKKLFIDDLRGENYNINHIQTLI